MQKKKLRCLLFMPPKTSEPVQVHIGHDLMAHRGIVGSTQVVDENESKPVRNRDKAAPFLRS